LGLAGYWRVDLKNNMELRNGWGGRNVNWLFSFLCHISNRMDRFKITRLIYALLRYMGLINLAHTLFGWWYSLHPTQQMLRDKEFFHNHRQELRDIYDMLEDGASKSVFENILKFRALSGFKYVKKAMGSDTPKTQYLVPEIEFSDHEVIVDCGAYTGDTAKKFQAASPGCLIIGLEPDDQNYKLLSNLSSDRVITYKCGAWSQDTALSFADDGGGKETGTISEAGDIKVEVKALDHLPECQNATYIKMDIEGAELEALKGAKNIIKNNKPKLAICIYHNPQDLIEIPLYIKNLKSDYRLYVHHHAWSSSETVLYAV